MPDNSAKIVITDEVLQQYKDTCIQWDPVLRQLPIRAAADVLKYFIPVKKLRGKRRFGEISGKSQFAPFKRDRVSQASVDIDYREIETFHGNVIETFAPVDYLDIPLGYDDPVITEAIKKAGTTFLVLAQLVKARGQHIAQCAFTGKRNPEGDTTLDLCDGLLTIADAEVEAGNISEAKGNLYKVGEEVTKVNACDIAKDILFTSNQFLRRENNVMLCPTAFADAYNESYLLSHNGLVYNKQYDQPYVEGSGHKLTIIPVPELDGTDRAIVTQRSNLLYGTYNDADQTSVDIMRAGHYDLSMASDMWLGFQYRTIDPRRFRYIDLSAA
ncbi:hypothetical protein [uncultured Duncaniella sp.]|jgi:hypothetical protein|uniref:hypothetical protein n=1 Tax=uncultured Duncaniella sp. TaxID=2768039 RepID=UPI0025A9DB9B|nr:hypothetical protein [uncultured Duncaniella sp.]